MELEFLQISQHVVKIFIKYCIEELETPDVIISNGNMKYPIGKSIFAVKKKMLKLFHVTFANADIGSLKSLHTFL